MADHNDLAERIQAEFAAADEQLKKLRDEKLHQYEDLQRRHESAEREAKRLAAEVVRPRIRHLLEHFDNAELVETSDHDGCHCSIRFKHTPRFPASTQLTIGVTYDAEVRNLLVVYDLEIMPIFMQYERNDSLSLPLDAVDDDKAAQWVEDKLVDFTRTYLRLEFVDQYQRENLVTDPVADLRISKLIAEASAEHAGHTYYFLTRENKDRFLEDPERYVSTGGGR